MGNVTDLNAFREDRPKWKIMGEFNTFGNLMGIMPLPLQMEAIKQTLIAEVNVGTSDLQPAGIIHSLVRLQEDLFSGLHQSFESASFAMVRKGPAKLEYLLEMSFTSLTRTGTPGDKQTTPELEIGIGLYETEDPNMWKDEGINSQAYDVSVDSTASISEAKIRHLITRLNQMAMLNDGVTFVTTKGDYMMVLPWSPKYVYVVNIIPERGIELRNDRHDH